MDPMQEIIEQLVSHLPQIEAAFVAAAFAPISLAISYHIIMSKNDVRAAIGWVGLVWLVPFLGALLYLLLGVNRLKRKAARLHAGVPETPAQPLPKRVSLDDTACGHLKSHVDLVDQLGAGSLSAGNNIHLLDGGDEAFPNMITAIDEAKHSILLSSYIFGGDTAGSQFARALAGAAARGVDVKVLLDGIGDLYHWPLASRILRKSGVQVARFNGSFLPWRMAYLNMRNHRKILVVDGQLGFTGGMNLRSGNLKNAPKSSAIKDVHFRLTGPVIKQMVDIFADDWRFATGETVSIQTDIKQMENAATIARGIADGPDEEIDRVSWVLRSILGTARSSVSIVTPYFLPDRILFVALVQAALRGVDVRIYVPMKTNLRVVGWAARAQYEQLLEGKCRIFHTPAPFNHSKLMTVDECWTLFGSTNWDPRSLRLNFEFNVECFSKDLARSVASSIDRVAANSIEVHREDVCRTNPLIKFRNGIAWLFSPYL